MKKLLLVLTLSLPLFLQGCGGGGQNSCSFSNLTPGATYLIIITNSQNVSITLTRVASSTGTITVQTPISCGNVVAVLATNSNQALSASPSSIYLPSPPSTATITGQSFDATYGMPRVEYFDGNGYLVGAVYASSVSGSTSLQASVPDLSAAYSGNYVVRVTNKTSQGYYANTVGTAGITAWGRDRVDSDGDGWYDDQDCDPYDPYLTNNCGGEVCGGGQEPITVCP
ncbi:MAG: hypothetical protein JO360_12820 [Acidobacteria bacterium]|nr:hypothetical protein [Acidobacteriota bacterium]